MGGKITWVALLIALVGAVGLNLGCRRSVVPGAADVKKVFDEKVQVGMSIDEALELFARAGVEGVVRNENGESRVRWRDEKGNAVVAILVCENGKIVSKTLEEAIPSGREGPAPVSPPVRGVPPAEE